MATMEADLTWVTSADAEALGWKVIEMLSGPWHTARKSLSFSSPGDEHEFRLEACRPRTVEKTEWPT